MNVQLGISVGIFLITVIIAILGTQGFWADKMHYDTEMKLGGICILLQGFAFGLLCWGIASL